MLIAQRPTLTEESINPQRSRFVIEPLEPGFGYTLGNSLRRTLLSSIPGAAVTSVRISGALHEFTTLPGVVEDVTEILLNIKGIVLTSEYDEPVSCICARAARAKPWLGTSPRRPASPLPTRQQHIATLADDGELEIEFTVERGRGYVPAQMNKQDTDEIGRIPVDSIYSPVLKVSYKVEATRVEQRTDFDKLILDVETKPAISPRDAVASAGSTLVELFGLCRELNVQAEGVEVGPAPVAEETNPEMAVPIEDLNLTQRSYNCLKREGIHTIGELVAHTEQDLLDIRNFGMKSIDEVKDKLQSMGLSLKSSPLGFDTNNLEGGTFFSPEDE